MRTSSEPRGCLCFPQAGTRSGIRSARCPGTPSSLSHRPNAPTNWAMAGRLAALSERNDQRNVSRPREPQPVSSSRRTAKSGSPSAPESRANQPIPLTQMPAPHRSSIRCNPDLRQCRRYLHFFWNVPIVTGIVPTGARDRCPCNRTSRYSASRHRDVVFLQQAEGVRVYVPQRQKKPAVFVSNQYQLGIVHSKHGCGCTDPISC